MTALLANPAAIAPQFGESQVDFIDRVWDSVPGVDDIEKARFCRDAWFQSGNDADLLDIASRRFPEDQYRSITGSPVFKEHSTKRIAVDPATGAKHEEPVLYDRDAIGAVCDRNNQRIRSSGDFSPLADGHTPDKDMLSKGARDPDVLGYSGPFYLGKLAGQFAIFSDEHHDRSCLSRIDKLQRRSPEVWLEDRMEERFFDPIACLGSRTPRLDLGMTRYDRTGTFFETVRGDGAQLMKYAAPAAAPGAANGFVPNLDNRRDYEAQEGEENMAMDPNEASSIVQAIMDSQMGQFCQAMMPHMDKFLALVGAGTGAPAATHPAPPAAGAPPAAAAAPGAAPAHPPAAPPAPKPPAPPAAPAAGHPAPAPGGAPTKPPYQPDDDDKKMMARYMGGECDDTEMQSYMAGKKTQYSALPGAAGIVAGMVNQPAPAKEGYSKDNGEVQAAQYSMLLSQRDARIAELEQGQRKAERYSRLSAKQAQGWVFDADAEYLATEGLSDDQFKAHVDQQITKYERIPLASVVPVFETPVADKPVSHKEHYAKSRAHGIQRIVRDERNSGREMSWETAASQWDAQHPSAK